MEKKEVYKLINQFHRDHNVLPDAEYLVNTTQLDRKKIIPVLKEVHNKAVKEKYFHIKKTTQSLEMKILTWTVFYISAIGTLFSIYYTFLRQVKTSHPIIAFNFATILSAVVLVSSILIVNFYKTKGIMPKIASLILLVILSSAVLYSINNTINGQFDKIELIKDKDRSITANNVSDKSIIDTYDEQISRLNGEIESTKEERDDYKAKKKKYDDSHKRYWLFDSYVERENKKIASLNKELKDIESLKTLKLQENKDLNKIKRNNYVAWISNTFKIDKENFTLFDYLYPAIFADIISPLFMSLFFLLRKREK